MMTSLFFDETASFCKLEEVLFVGDGIAGCFN